MTVDGLRRRVRYASRDRSSYPSWTRMDSLNTYTLGCSMLRTKIVNNQTKRECSRFIYHVSCHSYILRSNLQEFFGLARHHSSKTPELILIRNNCRLLYLPSPNQTASSSGSQRDRQDQPRCVLRSRSHLRIIRTERNDASYS